MKNILQPKYIIIFVLLVAGFFLIRKQLEGSHDVLIAGDQSNALCPVHKIKLKLDTVEIFVRKQEPDSSYSAFQRKNYPMAQDTFYLIEWFKDDEHKDVTRAQIWYCPLCREAKKKYDQGLLR